MRGVVEKRFRGSISTFSLTGFTTDLLRFEPYLSCSVRGLRKDSILASCRFRFFLRFLEGKHQRMADLRRREFQAGDNKK